MIESINQSMSDKGDFRTAPATTVKKKLRGSASARRRREKKTFFRFVTISFKTSWRNFIKYTLDITFHTLKKSYPAVTDHLCPGQIGQISYLYFFDKGKQGEWPFTSPSQLIIIARYILSGYFAIRGSQRSKK